MICDIHGTEMEWVPNDLHPEGGYWYCEQCRLDEEADFNPEHSDFEEEAVADFYPEWRYDDEEDED